MLCEAVRSVWSSIQKAVASCVSPPWILRVDGIRVHHLWEEVCARHVQIRTSGHARLFIHGAVHADVLTILACGASVVDMRDADLTNVRRLEIRSKGADALIRTGNAVPKKVHHGCGHVE